MFESIRQHQRILLGFLLLLIFPAFAFFGISGYDRMFSDEGVVARVDGERITNQEYELAHIAKRILMTDHRFGDADYHLERFVMLSGAAA